MPESFRFLVDMWDRTSRVRTPFVFLAGVLWDYSTLRLENTLDQVLLALYLAAFLALVVFSERLDRKRWLPELVTRASWLVPLASQFLLGALLSALAISVWRASHPGPASLFVALIVALAVANETRMGSSHGSITRFAMVGFLSFQVLSMLIPFATGMLWGPLPALFGALGLVAGTIWVARVHVASREPPPTTVARTQDLLFPSLSAAGAILTLLASTWLGLVPPLPLAMKRAAVATGIERTADGPELSNPLWTDGLARLVLGRPGVTWGPGDEVVVYTAVHAPADMSLELIHQWEHYDIEQGWLSTDRIPLEIRGGRAEGWRTWSRKRHLSEGDWRVRVQTPYGQELGRVPFSVSLANVTPSTPAVP